MKKILLFVFYVIASFIANAQADGTFDDVTANALFTNGKFSNGLGSSGLDIRNGSTSIYTVKYAETTSADTDGYLQIYNAAQQKGISIGPTKIHTNLPWAMGGTKIKTGFTLSVNGKFVATEAWVQATSNGGWPDYVFGKDYQLSSLADVERFIKVNSHLPEVPSAKEVEANGVNMGDMHAILLRKMEEMTLYMIEANKEITRLKEEVATLKMQSK